MPPSLDPNNDTCSSPDEGKICLDQVSTTTPKRTRSGEYIYYHRHSQNILAEDSEDASRETKEWEQLQIEQFLMLVARTVAHVAHVFRKETCLLQVHALHKLRSYSTTRQSACDNTGLDGDFRVNQNVGLLVLHTLFLREHNRIARKLSAINPHWDDERTFQVTRRIVESRYQNVVFNEWLPEVIGPEATKRYGLHARSSGYTKYDPHVDPTMVNEFAAAAFRFSHSDIHGHFKLYGDTAVTNYLFRMPGGMTGSDLFAIDIQRGRDHGTRPYSDYVKLCRNVTIDSFEDLYEKKLMPAAIAKLYSTIYGSPSQNPRDVSPMSEMPLEGAAMGPTFLCIVSEMFSKLKYGDRFYFEHGQQAGSFTPGKCIEFWRRSPQGCQAGPWTAWLMRPGTCLRANWQAPRFGRGGGARRPSGPEPSGCPFARSEHRSERSVTSVARSAKITALYEETTKELLARLGEGDEAARKAALAHVNRRLKCDTGDSCSHVCPLQEGATCDPDSPYREPDGSCNNLANPGWGKAYACEKRLLDAVYADGN
ncbi:hypothetical protein HPB48_013780 [Haemaphysalis longicornis]|uniref:Peroxidase n=1 Tax=Haemaphysalis longicornis TaxID=44386 RepID=A0A9J6FL67_HAELO|nr:hypothetical protein HPB48_013780 [Haemaphysalis longicornis]